MASTQSKRQRVKCEYNPSHVINYFQNEMDVPSVKDICTIQQDDTTKLFFGRMIHKQVCVETKDATGFNRKQEVMADLISLWLISTGRELPNKYRTNRSSELDSHTPKTPSQTLNEFCYKKNIVPNVSDQRTTGGWIVDIKLMYNNQLLQATFGPFIDKKYCKHKASLSMLKSLSILDDDAHTALQKLRKEIILRRGDQFALEEGPEIEFKGGDNPLALWERDNLIPVLSEKDKRLSAYICGFLNSASGGTLWYGIHDNTRVVHGIYLSAAEKDEISRILENELKKVWPPTQARYTFHELLDYEAANIDNNPLPDGTPEQVMKRFQYLRKETIKLQEKIQMYETKTDSTKKFYLLEVNSPKLQQYDKVYWAGHTAWKKAGSTLTKLEPEEIVKRLTQSNANN